MPRHFFHLHGGNCDCGGNATGLLTLQNYTPGDIFNTANFVSFNYSSRKIITSFGPGPGISASGTLGSTPGQYDVDISNDDLFFFFFGLVLLTELGTGVACGLASFASAASAASILAWTACRTTLKFGSPG